MANLKYGGHLISVSTIFDTPAHYQFTPVSVGNLYLRVVLSTRPYDRNFFAEAELLGKLREHLSKVKLVNIESDGQISVIQYEEKPHKPPERRGK